MKFFAGLFALFAVVMATTTVNAVDECPKVCPYNNLPVCAINSYGEYKTFPNLCTMKFESCSAEDKFSVYQFVKAGECEEILLKKANDNCPIACTEEFHAVCAQNMYGEYKTFPNLCMLQAESCRTEDKNAAYQFVKEGECPAVKSKTDCMYMCTDDYRPVCAQNAYGEFKTFPNMCGLEGENCGVEDTNAVYTFVKQGECQAPTPVKSADECPKFCPANYRPVCGQNIYGEFKAFPNMCMLNAENCKIEDKNTVYQFVKEGECQTVRSKDDCIMICTADYNPVCAQNANGEYKTFGNMCMLVAENCRIEDKSSVYQFLGKGEC